MSAATPPPEVPPQATPPADPPASPPNPPTPPAAPVAPPQPSVTPPQPPSGSDVLDAIAALPERIVTGVREGIPQLSQPATPPVPVKVQRRSFGEWFFGIQRKGGDKT